MGKPKPGKVVRLTPDLVRLIEENRTPKETLPQVIRRLLGLGEKGIFALPSDLFESLEDARGEAILRAVREKRKTPEKPVEVKVRRGA